MLWAHLLHITEALMLHACRPSTAECKPGPCTCGLTQPILLSQCTGAPVPTVESSTLGPPSCWRPFHLVANEQPCLAGETTS
jgi:hypothetical protein